MLALVGDSASQVARMPEPINAGAVILDRLDFVASSRALERPTDR